MKKFITIIVLFVFVNIAFTQEAVVFHEGFEGGSSPAGWTQERVKGLGGSSSTVNWQYLDGGYYDYPDNAYQGNYNAMFQLESYENEATILITPPVDLTDVLKPELRFAHIQQTWYFTNPDETISEYNDILNVYYKRGEDSSWVLLKSYQNAVEDWVIRSILLPDSSLSSTYYIGFEGITGFGYGTCIDTVSIMETGIIAKYIESYSIQQASTDFIPTNTTNNPILNITMDIQGNDGTLFLDSLKVTSLNTNDDNIASNGVKLYATADSTFKNPVLIKSGVNFVDGHAWFKDINYDLPRGVTTLWITYDIATAVDHEIHNNIVDAKIETEGIHINGSAFPFADKSPDGERLLKEAIFNDTFESDLGWTLNGSFERAAPLGLTGGWGNPDPENAYNGTYILGTDLTSDGVYSNSLTNRQDSAVSPIFDCFYYKDVTLYFVRWLNIEFFDNCYIDISTDSSVTWNQLWENSGSIVENSWSTLTYELADADFKENVNVRFGLGATNGDRQYTGWNIDDFIIVGDFISKDVGITGITMPETGCGHTASDDITVYIENYAGEISPTSVPVRYEIDNSGSYITDAYGSSIPIGDSALFTFSVGADLSSPGFHTIDVETMLSGDEISGNNSMSKTIFSFPTYSLPYFENFESNNGYYLPGGSVFSTWAYGEPAGTIINSAASGTNAWVTNLTGEYLNNDSSFIQSPCFNFAGYDSIIFEFRATVVAEDQTDGLTVLYSTDEGASWNVVPNDGDFYWNWYNETLISELELPGIDTTDGQWITFRQLLPPQVSNQSNVKFRFMFESNGSFKHEGVGIDNVKIYEAPADVGVSSIVEPFTACEWSDTTQVKVNIENFGITTLDVGSKVPVSLDFNGSHYTTDTLTLASPLNPCETVEFTFTETVDMSYADDYDFVVYTLLESNSYFYNDTVSNDTTTATVTVQGMPQYDLGWIVGSEDVDTLLDAGAGYNTYSWYFGGSEVATTQTYRAQAEGIYYITVTNGIPCSANDSLKVTQSLNDVKMDSIRTILEDSCLMFEQTEIWAAISNKGINFIDDVNDTIPFGYQINNLPEVHDTLFLNGRDLTITSPNDTISFTFAQKCDLTVPGEYTIKVFTNFLDDLDRSDDTVKTTINTWGLPDVQLAYDTIQSSQADTLTLDAGAGFGTYNWNSGSSIQTETPTNSSYYYKVTVTDIHACGSDKDSTYIETHDLGISAVTSPVNICEDLASASTPLNVEVANYSDNVYSGPTTVRIFYNFDNQGWNEVNPELNVGATDSVILTNIATLDVTNACTHTLKVYTSSDIDVKNTNDTLEYVFQTYPLPDVDLTHDTIFTTQADTVELIAQEGFATYNWNSGSTNDTLIVANNYTYNYVVTVTDVNGCGSDVDSTQIITYNVGINDLVYPLSACEHNTNEKVIVSVRNYSYDTLQAGTVIPVGYTINGGTTINENFTLSSALDPQQSVNYTFTTRADLSSINTYNFELFTNYELDVASTNDTYIDVIKTFGYPTIDLGDDIYTTQPDTVILVAAPGFQGYYWDEGTRNDSLPVTYLATQTYTITVNDINGCTAEDSITVYTYDIAPVSLTSPASQCELTNAETVSINVINNSLDTLTNETINVSYILNSGSPVNESFSLTDTLKPTETISYTFSQTADLSNNQLHEFDISAQFADYDAETNDGITVNVDYQKPEFDLGDPVVTGNSEYTIDAGSGYTSYLWFDNSVDQTYTVDINDQNPSHYYAVTVTNSDGCEANDSIEVTFTTTADLSVTNLSSPDDDCWQQSQTYPVTIEITNSGIVNLNPGTSFTVGYTIGDGTPVTETFNLSTAMDANDTRTHTFEDEISFDAPEIYRFKPFVKLAEDGNLSNDTLTSGTSVNISGPEVVLGPSDTLFFTTSVQLSTSVSYNSYLWNTGETTESIIVTETGLYSVTVTDGFECQGEGDIFCQKATGIDNMISGNGYEVTYYPNPVSDKLLIDFKLKVSTDITVEIVSSNGKIIFNNKLNNIEDRIERIDVNKFAHGVYYLRISINQDVYIRKIIIQ